jgi:predicted RNase H-like HicB family nuclease
LYIYEGVVECKVIVDRGAIQEQVMLVYKSAYRWEDSVCLGEVLDFPGTVSFGNTLDEARENLAGALLDMAETNLLRGEPLPLPDATRTDPQSELEEPIYLVLHAGQHVSMQVATPAP